MISAPSCSEMANSKTFITPQGRKSEAIVVPGRTYIMEFEVGFQTALNSVIKCQGQDILLEGSIQKGIVQHVEYVIQVERGHDQCGETAMQPTGTCSRMCRSIAHICMDAP